MRDFSRPFFALVLIISVGLFLQTGAEAASKRHRQNEDPPGPIVPTPPSDATKKPATTSTNSPSTTLKPTTTRKPKSTTTTTATATNPPKTTTSQPSITTQKPDELECGRYKTEEVPLDRRSSKSRHQNRVAHGIRVKPGEIPWQVGIIGRRGSGLFKKFSCSGVIVDKNHILTTGRCVSGAINGNSYVLRPDQLHVMVGSINIQKPEEGGYELEIDKIIRHEEFEVTKSVYRKNNIAIIKVKNDIRFELTSDGKDSTNNICLPESGQMNIETERQLEFTGFGSATHHNHEKWPKSRKQRFFFWLGYLNRVTTYAIKQDACKMMYQEARSSHRFEVDKTVICTEPGRKTPCKGDEGAPLFHYRNSTNQAELIGLSAMPNDEIFRCGNSQLPNVFIKVSEYVDWINRHAKSAMSS